MPLRLEVAARIKDLTIFDLREICNIYGADASGTLVTLQKECISLLDDLSSRRDCRAFNDFKDLVFRGAHAPWSGSTQSHAGLQQFSGVTAQDSSRFHAGNSYVEHQNNYYAPNTMTPQALNSESQDVLALLSALEFPEMNLRRVIIEKEFPGTCT
jgi:hypothetical protein